MRTDSTSLTSEAVPAVGDSKLVGQDWSFPVNGSSCKLTDNQDIYSVPFAHTDYGVAEPIVDAAIYKKPFRLKYFPLQ